MQTKSFQTLNIQAKLDVQNNNQFDYLSGNRSPTSIYRNFSNGFISNQENSVNGIAKAITQNNLESFKRANSFHNNENSKRFSYDPKPSFNTTLPEGKINKYNDEPNQEAIVSTKTIPIDRTSSVNNVSTSSKDQSFDKTLQLNLLKIQNQSLKTQNVKSKQIIIKLREQLSQKAEMLNKFNQLMKIKYSELKQVKAQSQSKDKAILELKKQLQNQLTPEQSLKLKQELFLTKKKYDELNYKINNLQHENFRNQAYQMKIAKLHDQLEQQKTKEMNLMVQNSKVNQRIKELQEQVAMMEYQKQKGFINYKISQFQKIQSLFKNLQTNSSNSPSKNKNQVQTTHLAAFDQALKVQIKQIQQLKQTIESSQEVIQKLRDNLITSRKQLEQLRGQIKILDLKYNTERKKLIMEYRLQIHDKDNQINTAFKRYKTLEQKYKNALIDIKAKDDFLRQHLVGRTVEGSVQEYIQNVLKEYTQNFDSLVDLKGENRQLLQKLERYRRYEADSEQLIVDNRA